MNKDRKYIAISIKHSTYELKKPYRKNFFTLWGYKRTNDDDKRCFSGYTIDIEKCELYTLDEFYKEHGNEYCKTDEPVKMKLDLCKRYKKWDTVLVDIDDYKNYLGML